MMSIIQFMHLINVHFWTYLGGGGGGGRALLWKFNRKVKN